MSELSLQPRVLGVDFGKARIGLAISDELGMLAHPLETVPADPNAVRRIAEVAKTRKVARVVVGLPRHMGGGEAGAAVADVSDFVQKLRASVSCEVVTQDERLTTVAAERALRESGRNSRSSRRVIDQVAAQMILQTYLDSQQRECQPG